MSHEAAWKERTETARRNLLRLCPTQACGVCGASLAMLSLNLNEVIFACRTVQCQFPFTAANMAAYIFSFTGEREAAPEPPLWVDTSDDLGF
eukprot:m.257817 g.257817  ORF g.257817 m.257817 type:complete len:92 (-) comp21083_c0_seq1:446-721(-)